MGVDGYQDCLLVSDKIVGDSDGQKIKDISDKLTDKIDKLIFERIELLRVRICLSPLYKRIRYIVLKLRIIDCDCVL